MSPGDRDSGLGLAEVIAAFSLATDLGLGQPMEHVLRSWAIATRLGEHMGIESENAAALYYVAMLAWVGCVADTPEVANWFGDDIAFPEPVKGELPVSWVISLSGCSGC